MTGALLIRNASRMDGRRVDVALANGRIIRMGEQLPADGAAVLEAAGGLIIPGLHDHHVHAAATAAARASVRCGPPDVTSAEDLAARLATPGPGWLRGVGYHESVAGLPDRRWLDGLAPDRPVRIQHRSGRMWFLNSRAVDVLLASGVPAPEGLDRVTGRLFDADDWMRAAIGAGPPAFDAIGATWSRHGVTGVTDMSPSNDARLAMHFASEQARGALPQRVVLAGGERLGEAALGGTIALGPLKLHLHEAHLPELEGLEAAIARAHGHMRAVAFHCVSEIELVFALAALRGAGVRPGDRIEHASICPDALVTDIAEMGLTVVTQPNFVAERGDAYREAFPAAEWANLYRMAAFLDAGVALAGGTDTPFGDADPWRAMTAAVMRETASGAVLGAGERLTPEAALSLFLADPADLSVQRRVAVGEAADLCLLNKTWVEARRSLSADDVRATFIAGRCVHDRVDEAPVTRDARADAFA